MIYQISLDWDFYRFYNVYPLVQYSSFYFLLIFNYLVLFIFFLVTSFFLWAGTNWNFCIKIIVFLLMFEFCSLTFVSSYALFLNHKTSIFYGIYELGVGIDTREYTEILQILYCSYFSFSYCHPILTGVNCEELKKQFEEVCKIRDLINSLPFEYGSNRTVVAGKFINVVLPHFNDCFNLEILYKGCLESSRLAKIKDLDKKLIVLNVEFKYF
jgi:hypothetical protein